MEIATARPARTGASGGQLSNGLKVVSEDENDASVRAHRRREMGTQSDQ